MLVLSNRSWSCFFFFERERSDGFLFCLVVKFWFQSYSEMIAERRKRVADGFEDIYGKNKTS